MRKCAPVLSGVACLGLAVGTVHATTLFQDDFESYADEAALDAVGAWGDDSSGGGIPYPNGNPGKGMVSFGGASGNAYHVFSAYTPSDAQPLVWEFDLLDRDNSDLSMPAATRLTGGLRDNGGGAALGALLEMGIYNAAQNLSTGANENNYAVRNTFVGATPVGNGGWVAFPGVTRQIGSWHHLKATIGATFITYELDLGDDGTVDSTLNFVTTASAKPYNVARFGGPSGVSSDGPAATDNWNIEVVPEPATLSLLALGGMLLRRRRTA